MKKYWLVFYADDGQREACSVYYSWLVNAVSKADAIALVVAKIGLDARWLDAEEKEVLS